MAPRISSSPRPVLCAVLDGAALGPDPETLAARLFRAGVDWIQLRDRTLESDALYRLARSLVATAAVHNMRAERDVDFAHTARVILNRRADIVLATGADGVHLGFDAVDPADARQLLGARALIGASLHSASEALAAGSGDLDYAHLAPIWDPISKPASRPALGLEALTQATRSGLPLIAQGGLDPQRAAWAVQAGAAGIAVTGLLAGRADPEGAARELRQHLDQATADKSPDRASSRNQGSPTGDTEPMP